MASLIGGCSWLCALALYLLVGTGQTNPTGGRICQQIYIPMCRDIGYNMTYMPSLLNHNSQEEAGMELHQFWPLVEVNCSPDLRFFLCSLYAPKCSNTTFSGRIGPCKAVCERVKAGCEPLMRQYGFSWPARLECSNLPEENLPDRPCIDNAPDVPDVADVPDVPVVPDVPEEDASLPGDSTEDYDEMEDGEEEEEDEDAEGREKGPTHCQPITLPACTGIGYDLTYFPNSSYRHQNQYLAGLQMFRVMPLVPIECSPDVRYFLCSLYIPKCSGDSPRIPPCRSLCQRARTGCEPIMVQFGLPWPQALACDDLPEGSDGGTTCLDRDSN